MGMSGRVGGLFLLHVSFPLETSGDALWDFSFVAWKGKIPGLLKGL